MEIAEELKKRILILDGGMGTCIQDLNIEYDGNTDMLPLTMPHAIKNIHSSYINAGADIIETCTFGANAVSQEGYGCAHQVYQMNLAGAEVARQAANECTERKIWVMGSMGPTAKSLTIAEMMMEPGETLTFNTLTAAYLTQAEGLIDGGVDGFLVETVTDARNALSALTAISQAQKSKGTDFPIMLSASIMNNSGCLMTGCTLPELFSTLSAFPLLSAGLNCSFGAKELYPFVKTISESVKCAVSIYPNAGLPTANGYEERPADTARELLIMANNGLINIAGGCCGTTPAHIKEITRQLKGIKPRVF